MSVLSYPKDPRGRLTPLDIQATEELVTLTADALEVGADLLRRLRAERDSARRERDALRERLRDSGFPDR